MRRVYLVLAILWFGFISYMSSRPSDISMMQTQEVISYMSSIPILGDIIINLAYSGKLYFVIRKSAHMFIYFVMSMFIFLFIYGKLGKVFRTSFFTMIIIFVVGCVDEFHQLFIPGRGSSFGDVMIDCMGGFIGVMFMSVCVSIANYLNNT